MDKIEDEITQAYNLVVSPSNLPSNVDADSSSNLSELEDKSARDLGEDIVANNRDDEVAIDRSEILSNVSDGINDSEAETVHMEESSVKPLSPTDSNLAPSTKFSYNKITSYELRGFAVENLQGDEGEEAHTSDKVLVDEFLDSARNSIPNEADNINLEDPNTSITFEVENKEVISKVSSDSRKRKRSILGVTVLGEINEPLRKRTGSILAGCNGYFNEDEIAIEEISSNFVAENHSAGEERGAPGEESTEDAEEDAEKLNIATETPDTGSSSCKIGQKKKILYKPNVLNNEEDAENTVDQDSIVLGLNPKTQEVDMPINEEDENDVAIRNDEAIERKRNALDRLSGIERQFSIFRERLYEERLKHLNDEDDMLRQPQPSHPEYLAWLQCIDARRDERIRIAEKQYSYKLQCLKKVAVAQRSQILAQYQQEIRGVREHKLEQLGEQWYKIQHDRRNSTGICPEFSLRFPRKRSQQLLNHIAYCNEVSILSGVAKYVGFPAAPIMAPASAIELEEDLEKIGRSKRNSQAPPPVSFHDLVALRAISSSSKYKPVEVQHVEQTSLANPKLPLNLNLVQGQVSSYQFPRTVSPFTQIQTPRRKASPRYGGQKCGNSSNSYTCHQITGMDGTCPQKDSVETPDLVQKIPQTCQASRQASVSPHSGQALANIPDSIHLSKTQAIHNIKSSTISPVATVNIDLLHESRLSA